MQPTRLTFFSTDRNKAADSMFNHVWSGLCFKPGQWNRLRAIATGLGMLGLIAVMEATPAYAGKHSSAPKGEPKESCECVLPWREYTRTATPEVKALFEAAANVDESTFNRLIGSIPDLQEYAVDDRPLLAVLLSPAKNLSVGRNKVWWDMTPEQAGAIRAAHAATLPAKTRMLALALQHGASVKDVTYSARHPPLHLAMAFGSPEMVRLLLQHGADVNQQDTDRSQTAIEFALDNEYFIRMTYLPMLVDPVQRTEMAMAMLAAGAERPFTRIDKAVEGREGQPRDRPAADYLLWPAVAEMTRGSEVMEAFSRTGTAPILDAENLGLSPLGHAARSGNLGGLKWLKAKVQRVVSDGDRFGHGEHKFDTWLLAASWALYPTKEHVEGRATVDEILRELIQPDMPWLQKNELNDQAHNLLLSNRDMRQPTAGRSLLHHLVFAGKEDWVERVVKLGAPVDGDPEAEPTPLLEAVRAGDIRMVRLLLSLGADPLAGPELRRAPLFEAIAADYIYRDDSRKPAERARLERARREALTSMLAQLSPQRKAALGESGHSPLVLAFEQYGQVDGPLVRALLDAGISPKGLGSEALIAAMRSDDRELLGALLDRGLPIAEGRSAGNDRRSTRRPLLVEALANGRQDLLPRLLRAGADPNLPDAHGRSAVAWAVAQGDLAALDLLLASGGRIEQAIAGSEKQSLLELALVSGSEGMLRRLAPSIAADVSKVCLNEPWALRRVVLNSGDAFWKSLLAQGLGRQSGDTAACAGSVPMSERLVVAVLADKGSIEAGWRGSRLSSRLRDLALVAPPSVESGEALMHAALADGRDDVVQALAGIGIVAKTEVTPKDADAEPKPSTADRAIQRKLVGHYYLENQREVGSEILLHADGRFEYMLAYGAADEMAVGEWKVRNGKVLFRTPLQTEEAGWVPYERKLAGDGAQADGTPASIRVLVSYRKRAVDGISVTAMGCTAPVMAAGKTGDDGWTADIAGPLCQIVLHHPRVNRGRAFVYQVPAADQGVGERRFNFELQPSKADGMTAFNVTMKVEKKALILQRSGRALRYVRQ